MDTEIEIKIVRAFCEKIFQSRFIYELSGRKRSNFIRKLCHRYRRYLKADCILDECKQFPAFEVCEQKMRLNSGHRECYVISEYPDFDGIYTDWVTAYDKLGINGFASITVGLPSGFAHFKAESYASFQPNCFLKPKNRFDGLPWDI